MEFFGTKNPLGDGIKVGSGCIACDRRSLGNEAGDDLSPHGDCHILPLLDPAHDGGEVLSNISDACSFHCFTEMFHIIEECQAAVRKFSPTLDSVFRRDEIINTDRSVGVASANKDSSGRSIYNPQDSGASIAANITGHIAKIFTPGTFDTAGRMIEAAGGVVSDSGRSYALGNEVMSAAGVRASEMDVRQSLGFKAKIFMHDYHDPSSLFTGALLSRGTRSGEDVASGYNKANDAIRELSEDFRQTYIGAMRLGVPQREVISALKANGISDETIKMLQTGKIKPYEASKQAIEKAQESGAKDRIDAYNRTYAAFKKILTSGP